MTLPLECYSAHFGKCPSSLLLSFENFLKHEEFFVVLLIECSPSKQRSYCQGFLPVEIRQKFLVVLGGQRGPELVYVWEVSVMPPSGEPREDWGESE